HARLVTGRKGTGKTAIFYGLRDEIKSGPLRLVLDLKPEGHQFTRLRETVLSRITPGLQEHTMTAFWNYLLLLEIAHKIVQTERKYADCDASTHAQFMQVKTIYGAVGIGPEEDFSERLLRRVGYLQKELEGVPEDQIGG